MKPKLVDSLFIALTDLQLADSHMENQTNTALMKQTELTRALIEKKLIALMKSHPKNISHAEAIQLSPIVLKSTSSQTF